MAEGNSIGLQLKKLRLEKGLSLEDVHKTTHIHLDVLKAIEDDNYINIDPVYLKGFLKIYCKLLGVELPDNIAGAKHTQVQLKVPEPVREKKDIDAGPDTLRRLVPIAVGAILVLVAAGVLFAGGRFLISKMSSMNKGRPHAQVVKLKKEKMARKTEQKVVRSTAPAKAGQSIPADQSLRLGIRALEDCWLQLKCDNKVVFQNVLKKGRFESWEADDRMELTLGSAGGVQVEINGKIIPSLGKRGQVLKGVTITRKDGLRVK